MLAGGLLPWDGFFTNLLHAFVIGPVRLFGYGLHKYFNSIIRKCAREDAAKKTDDKDADNAKGETHWKPEEEPID